MYNKVGDNHKINYGLGEKIHFRLCQTNEMRRMTEPNKKIVIGRYRFWDHH